jgi:tetratricopeptide (TPR) repeat protein
VSGCPSREQLGRLLAEELDGPEASAVESHVQSCPGCQASLADLCGECPLSVRSSPTPGEGTREPEPSSEFLRRLRQAVSGMNTPTTLSPREDDGTVVDDEARPRVGGFEIQGELGRGGMGVVYLARQVRLNRLVALKMIPGGAHAGPHERERFRAEAEAVARLQHPNVVQVFEAGEADGCPYLALEYVAGGSLTDRARETPWQPRAAAELVRTLARAVQAAHECGIVHRDLKPANVLVSADGTPKVTDFGLAKRLDSRRRTQSGAVVGTPAYMAPEQASGHGEAVGPAADVWALGAILYELVTGRPPFLAQTPLDTLLLVCNEDPVPPSALQPRLPRDLGTVCLKCLRKEPGKRYASARELADDLGRFLGGEPVRARPTPAWERAAKWVRRRPALAALLAALVVLPTTGVVLLARANRETQRQRDHALEQTARAEEKEREARAQTVRAEGINDFLLSDVLFEAAPERNPYSRQATVVDVLRRAAAKADRAFRDQPAQEADVRFVVGRVYLRLGLLADAEPQLRRSLELWRRVLGPDAQDTLVAMNELALLLHERGDYAGAERLFTEALESRRRVWGAEHPETLRVMDSLALTLKKRGRWQDAERLVREALDGRRKVRGRDHPETLVSMVNLAILLRDQGRPAEAEPLLREAVETGRKVRDPLDHELLVTLHDHAVVLQTLGRIAEAEPLFRESLAGHEKLQGPRHPATLNAANSYALLLKSEGKWDEAERLYVRSLDACTADANLGPTHPQTLFLKFNLAALWADSERLEKAEKAFREVLDVRRRRAPESRETLVTLDRLALTLLDAGKPSEAEPLLREALPLARKLFPAGHPEIASTLLLVGRAAVESGRAKEAEPLLTEALAIRRKKLPAGDWGVASAGAVLGDCLRAQGRYAEAEPLLRSAEAAFAKARGTSPRRHRDVIDRLVWLYEAWNKPAEAAAWRARQEKPAGGK